VLGERAAAIGGTRLNDARAKARVAGELEAKREISPISAAIVKASTQPTPGTVSSSGT
jgi:hypothetical protein